MMFRMTHPRSTPDWRPLALTLAGLTAAYAVAYRLMPFEMRGFFLWPFGAWALYSGARLTPRVAFPLTLGVFALSDAVLYFGSHIPPNYVFYVCLAASAFLGWGFLRRTQSPVRIVTGSLVSYAFFFLFTNFAAWLEPALPEYSPRSFETLLLAYGKGLEFLRMQPGHLMGDLVFGLGLFGAHAYLAKAYFPTERVVPEAAR
jgi:hypothetical protein